MFLSPTMGELTLPAKDLRVVVDAGQATEERFEWLLAARGRA